eukprot:3539378-Prymnesium_polylepis.1
MVLCTTGMGVLPTAECCAGPWASLGIALLFVCRAGQGLCAAGELASVFAFVVEHTAPAQHGLAFAAAMVASNVGALVAAVYAAQLESSLSEEQMMRWGWRLPFVSAFPLGLAIVWAQLKMPEPEAFSASGPEEGGILRAAWTTYRRQLVITTAVV